MPNNITDAAETNLIVKNDMVKVREIDFVNQFAHNSLAKLIEALGVTRKIAMQEGTTLYVYETSGTLESGSVAEGAVIPLSHYATTKTPVGEITLNKWRKATSAEAIMKSGYEAAVRDTDRKLLLDAQKKIRNDFFTLINGTITGATVISGATLQDVLAEAWAQLQIKFEDDTAQAVHFVNPLDIADYLKTAQISVQTAFGMNYVEDFLGLGSVIMSSRVTQGTVVSTAKQNLIMYYLSMNGDIGGKFGLTVDDLGYIGVKGDIPTEERAQLETLVMSGIQFFVEYAAGVIKATITGTLLDLEVTSVAGSANGKTKITYSGYTKGANDVLKYYVSDYPIAVSRDDDLTDWTTWNGSDDITAATGKIMNLAVTDSSYKALAEGHTTVTAKSSG